VKIPVDPDTRLRLDTMLCGYCCNEVKYKFVAGEGGYYYCTGCHHATNNDDMFSSEIWKYDTCDWANR